MTPPSRARFNLVQPVAVGATFGAPSARRIVEQRDDQLGQRFPAVKAGHGRPGVRLDCANRLRLDCTNMRLGHSNVRADLPVVGVAASRHKPTASNFERKFSGCGR